MNLGKPVILAVDDDVPTLTLLRTLLREFGFEPLTAGTGAEALEVASQQKPDLILVDRYMPGISGDELIRRLRNDAGLQRVPILILSGSPTERDEVAKLGADGAVQKPFDIPHLIGEIRARL